MSSATTIGHQRNHQSLLNSNISKLIHDQGILYTGKHLILELFVILGETSFCWAFSISSMLRQSLKLFIKTLLPTSRTQAALRKLEENEFHKRLRNELIMLPIPKAKFFQHKVPVGVNPMDVEDEIIEKQKHSVLNAINRVSLIPNVFDF